jgi:hypothetical protein
MVYVNISYNNNKTSIARGANSILNKVLDKGHAGHVVVVDGKLSHSAMEDGTGVGPLRTPVREKQIVKSYSPYATSIGGGGVDIQVIHFVLAVMISVQHSIL